MTQKEYILNETKIIVKSNEQDANISSGDIFTEEIRDKIIDKIDELLQPPNQIKTISR